MRQVCISSSSTRLRNHRSTWRTRFSRPRRNQVCQEKHNFADGTVCTEGQPDNWTADSKFQIHWGRNLRHRPCRYRLRAKYRIWRQLFRMNRLIFYTVSGPRRKYRCRDIFLYHRWPCWLDRCTGCSGRFFCWKCRRSDWQLYTGRLGRKFGVLCSTHRF